MGALGFYRIGIGMRGVTDPLETTIMGVLCFVSERAINAITRLYCKYHIICNLNMFIALVKTCLLVNTLVLTIYVAV